MGNNRSNIDKLESVVDAFHNTDITLNAIQIPTTNKGCGYHVNEFMGGIILKQVKASYAPIIK